MQRYKIDSNATDKESSGEPMPASNAGAINEKCDGEGESTIIDNWQQLFWGGQQLATISNNLREVMWSTISNNWQQLFWKCKPDQVTR